jgi:hypothetical protein
MDNLVCALEYGIKPRAISSADGALTNVLARWSEFSGQTVKIKQFSHISSRGSGAVALPQGAAGWIMGYVEA